MKIVTGLSYKYDYKGKWNTSAFVKHYMNHLEAYLDPEGGINYQDFSNTTSYWGGGWASTYFWGRHTQLRLSYEYALRLPTSRELFGSGDDIERRQLQSEPESSNNVNISVTANAVDLTDHRLTIDAAFNTEKSRTIFAARPTTTVGVPVHRTMVVYAIWVRT